MKKVLLLVCGILIVAMANAVANVQLDENGMPIRVADSTPCATAVFERGLANNIDEIKAADPQNMTELEAEHWVRRTLFKADILQEVLNCPEVASAPDDKEIKFETIKCTLPNGTVAQLNFNSTPQKLKQHAELNAKHERLARDPNPEIGGDNNNDIWTNTDPGWYAIMAVRTGALDGFVGPDKNNTIGLDYIRANIDSLFPTCAPDSALAADDNVFNRGVRKTIDMGDKDNNDYYVAGDVDLRWITYLEVAADVVLTIVSYGGWSLASGATKLARTGKLIDNVDDAIDLARGADKAKDYLVNSVRAANLADSIKDIDKTIDGLEATLKAADKIPDSILKLKPNELKQLKDMQTNINHATKNLHSVTGKKDALKYRNKLKSLQQQQSQYMKKVGVEPDDLRYIGPDMDDTIAAQKKLQEAKATKQLLQTEADDVANKIKALEETDEVQKLKELEKTKGELLDLQKGLRALGNRQTGNIFVRAGKTFKAIWSKNTNKLLNKAQKLGRASTRSARMRDWLFHSTMKNAGAIANLGAKAGLWYGALKFIGGMWDYTDVSTGDFTNGVDFAPLLLVSADDLKESGQDNVVNHGMWFMWIGDSIVAADDDAAYLQAMDFTAKLHQTLDDGPSCPMDLYVVRPLLRNPGTPDASIYYLIMNDEPWTVD